MNIGGRQINFCDGPLGKHGQLGVILRYMSIHYDIRVFIIFLFYARGSVLSFLFSLYIVMVVFCLYCLWSCSMFWVLLLSVTHTLFSHSKHQESLELITCHTHLITCHTHHDKTDHLSHTSLDFLKKSLNQYGFTITDLFHTDQLELYITSYLIFQK